jgi:hypothetical protein
MDPDGLIKALCHKNPGIRGRAALAPGDIGERAIKSLVLAFKKTDQRVGWLTGQQNGKSGRSEVTLKQVLQAACTGSISGFFYQLFKNLFQIADFVGFQEPAGKTILHKILYHRVTGIPARYNRFYRGIVGF